MKHIRLWFNTYDSAPFAWLKYYAIGMIAMTSGSVFVAARFIILPILLFLLGLVLQIKFLQTAVIGIKRSITGEARPRPLFIILDVLLLYLIHLILNGIR